VVEEGGGATDRGILRDAHVGKNQIGYQNNIPIMGRPVEDQILL